MTRLLLESENPWVVGYRYVAEEPFFIVYRNPDGSTGWIPYNDASPHLQERARQAYESAVAAEAGDVSEEDGVNEPEVVYYIIDPDSWTMGQGQRGTRYIQVEEPCE